MTDCDIEPTEQPDSGRIRDALQKGLGRAVLWARKGTLANKELLREACLRDQRYDRQTEEARGPWLWQLMEAVGALDDFREDILTSLLKIENGLAAVQLCELAVFYARSGDERFRRELRRVVAEKPVPDCPWLGEEELLALDGEAGFLFAARVRGQALRRREWEWDDCAMIDMAVDKLGEAVVVQLLEQEAAVSDEIGRFRDQWRSAAASKAAGPRPSHADRMRQIPLSDVIHAAEVARNQGGFLRGWGMYADERDLRMVLDRLLACQNVEALANYLRVFSNRALLDFDERLLHLLDHEHEHVRRRAYTAVAQNRHPAIRRFALRCLQERLAESNFVELFIRNWAPGDEHLLQNSIRVPEDHEDCHGLMFDVIKILEMNAYVDSQGLGLLAYRVTPCARCRFDAAKLLIQRKVAPAWLTEECRWDCVSDTRQLAVDSAGA